MPELPLLAATLMAYTFTALAASIAVARGAALERARWPLLVLGAGVVASGAAVALRWVRTGQGPFLTFFEVLLSNAFSLALIAVLAWRLVPLARAGAPFVGAALALLAAWCLTLPPEPAPLPATFASPWLWAHVLSGKLFLGTALVAAGVGAVLVRPGGGGARREAMLALVWSVARLAFVCETLMLVAGAVWAREAWGRYWGWDPLETWALVTWLALGAVLHANARAPLGARAAGWCAIGVLVLAHLTFLGVPFLSAAPHKGISL